MPTINPMSIAALANKIGVPRQRIYNEVKRGHIRVMHIAGDTLAISPMEADRVMDAVVRIGTRKGSRIVFDWV